VISLNKKSVPRRCLVRLSAAIAGARDDQRAKASRASLERAAPVGGALSEEERARALEAARAVRRWRLP
jgi:hypothetical protein